MSGTAPKEIAFGTIALDELPLKVTDQISPLFGRPSSEKVTLNIEIVVVEVLVDVDVELDVELVIELVEDVVDVETVEDMDVAVVEVDVVEDVEVDDAVVELNSIIVLLPAITFPPCGLGE